MDLALTLDYELFGDGSGDIFKDIIHPTDKILALCEQSNAKITIFFEVVEYWKIKSEWDNGNVMGYVDDPILAIEQQIIQAFSNGHDVQLHIHPQWLQSHYDDKWNVSDKWRMNDIPLTSLSSQDLVLETVLQQGKDILESLLQPISAQYQCNIFRAGGFNILPSQPIIEVLNKLNFKMDSSVFPGGYEQNSETSIDFRSLDNQKPFWFIHDGDVLSQINTETDGLIEIPTFSLPIRRYKKYDLSRIKALLRNKSSVTKTLKSKVANKSFVEKFMYFIEQEFITWDFCLFNKTKMQTFITYTQKLQNQSDAYHPLVLIGHSKGFSSDEALKYLLLPKHGYHFITLSTVLENIKKHE